MDADQPHGFYSDAVDDDGIVYPVTMGPIRTSWAGEIPMTKIPREEMALPDDTPVFRMEDADES